MTNALDELRRLLDEATAGPWGVTTYNGGVSFDGPRRLYAGTDPEFGEPRPIPACDADLDLAAFLRNHAEDLLAVCLAAEAFATTWIDGKCAYCLALSSLPEPCHHETASGAASLRAALARLSPTSEEGS